MKEELRDMRRKVAQLETEVNSLKQQLTEMKTIIENQGAGQKTTLPQVENENGVGDRREGASDWIREKEESLMATSQSPMDRRKETDSINRENIAQDKPSVPTSAKRDIRQTEPRTSKDTPVATSKNVKNSKKGMDIEELIGTWLPRVFMFILLLGVLWGLKVGMDNGWITNPVRVVLGYAGTALLLIVGIRYVRRDKNLFGHTLLGGFIALGILTTFAAHHLYGYFNFIAAFAVGIIYIVVGFVLSKRMNSETLTVFSAIAGFLLPFLLEGSEASTLSFCAYILLLFLSLFYVSLSEKHKYTFYVSFLLFHLTLFVYGTFEGVSEEEPVMVGTVIIQHLLLLFFYMKGSISRRIFTEVLIYTNFVFTVAWIKLLEKQQEVPVYGLFALLYVVLAVYLLRKKTSTLRGVTAAVAIFAVSVYILSVQWELEQIRAILLLLNGSIGLWVGLKYQVVRTIVTSAIVYGLTVYYVVTLVAIPDLLSMKHVVWLALLLTMLGVYYTVYRFGKATLVKSNKSLFDGSLIVGQLLLFIYINHATSAVMNQLDVAFPTTLHVKLLIFLFVLTLMYYFHHWKHGAYLTHAAFVGFGLIGLVLMAIPMTDFYDDGGFFFHLFVQVLYVLLFTACFVAIKRKNFYLKSTMLSNHFPKLAIVIQIVYFIFINKWYLALTDVIGWDDEYVLLGHTFLLFLFAFASVSIGGKMEWKYVRIGGFVLIVLCVFKLFFVDLASVSIVVRAILFIVVGVVGLLYSRTLLKEEKNN
ncbi:DUF2339 domain-containing protein [Virgibacillus sp. W0181]|uniref:DUF2339 domain-containing protein n=1 Tax=Virgibacillus sp. W0181 TaxID=3391581 RepID=UPI003F47663D